MIVVHHDTDTIEMEHVLTPHQADDTTGHGGGGIMSTWLTQTTMTDETCLVWMTGLGHQLAVVHNQLIYMTGGTETVVTGIPGTGPLAGC